MQENTSQHRPHPLSKIDSKWIADLSTKCRTLKLLEDDTAENPDDLGLSDSFLDNTAQGLTQKERIGELVALKWEIPALQETPSGERRQATDQEKVCAKDTRDRGLLSEIHKELLKLNSKKTNHPIF